MLSDQKRTHSISWAPATLAILVGLVCCGGVDVAGPSLDGSERPSADLEQPTVSIARDVTSGDDLVFPPPQTGREDRPPLPAEYRRAAQRELALVQPAEIDETLKIHGKELVFAFNKPMQGARDGAPAGAHLRVEREKPDPSAPPITGLARWDGDRTLRFEATRFFDPADRHRVTLLGLKSTSGERFADRTLPFVSTVGGTVAGKNIGHVPKPGVPRVVALDAPWEGEVAPLPHLSVLYDQPIAVDLARTLISLTDDDGQTIELSFRRGFKPTWDGVRVDPRFVVVVSPKARLTRGQKLTLAARDVRQGKIETALTVAEPMVATGATCGWWLADDAVCEHVGERLRTDRNTVHLKFSNRIGTPPRQLKGTVRVTPAVRNLNVSAEGWDGGRLVLTGDFRPSVRYQVLVAGLRDGFGQKLEKPVRLAVEMDPLGASVAMPEGLVFLDEASTKRFVVHSRNVEEAELDLWRVDEDDAAAFRAALTKARGTGETGTSPDERIGITIGAKRDALVETAVDLRRALAGGGTFLASLRPRRFAFGASPTKHAEGTPAARPPVALLKAGSAESLAVHAHAVGDSTLVHVARLASGEPVVGAEVRRGDRKGTTDKHGVVVLREGTGEIVDVSAGTQRLLLPVDHGQTASSELFPELARGEQLDGSARAFVATDRGIYRPGARIGMKAALMVPNGTTLRPLVGVQAHLDVVGPGGNRICRVTATTSDIGSVAGPCDVPADAKLGLHRIELRHGESVVAREVVRVADFEPPRFKVDIDADVDEASDKPALRAQVQAKYLFGSPMGGAYARWSLTRTPAELPAGALSDAGLTFRAERSWFSDEEPERWTRTGESALDDQGRLAVSQVLDLGGATGPQRFSLEADVTDASYRHVAAKEQIVVHPRSRYAGLSGPSGWVDVGQDVDVKLGVADREGEAVAGVPVRARLVRVSWRFVERLGPGGAVHTQWRRSEQEVASCSATSASRPTSCRVRVPRSGDYRLVAEVDGHDGGAQWFWAWSDDGPSEAPESPSQGSVVQIVADKSRYRAGDEARLLVRSPYPAATAITTVEMGGLIEHHSQRLDGHVGVVTLPIAAEHAPHVHASITLLPIGASGRDMASYRVGAIRLPVESKGTSLGVKVVSDRPQYRPGERATVTVEVSDGGKPEPHAEVALAVVDEGVLRLTDFHAVDPGGSLRPPMALAFDSFDSRNGLGRLFERSHVAGDGGGQSEGSMPHTRRRFVKTALWRPQLRTDGQGRATVSFELPDNLTEFRMMAVVFDREGKGGASESSFLVKKEIMLDAVLPRFAHVGDELELVAMVHNGGEGRFSGTAVIDGMEHPIEVPAGGRQRVALRTKAAEARERKVTMEVRDASGRALDRVERGLAVQQPGLSTHPTLAGAFRDSVEVGLTIPAAAMIEPDADLVIVMGEHLWPELGERMQYLLRYPHGCVEQTTSSTLPLIAGREIMPRIGFDQHAPSFYTERIAAGIERLSTMRTSSGGLAYWPGGSEPSIFGTAYAIRAVLGAERAGVALPPGMKEGMLRFLEDKLLASSTDIELRAVIAESLARRAEGLPPGIEDALWDRRGEMSAFAKASLTLALASDPKQEDRVRELLDELGALFDESGELKGDTEVHWRYYGSTKRTESQIARAFTAARTDALLLPKVLGRLAGTPDGYTTQATAFSLLALAEHLRGTPSEGAVVSARLDGEAIARSRELVGGGRELRVPLSALVGKSRRLKLTSEGGRPIGFALSADYRLPLEGKGSGEERMFGAVAKASAADGAHLYRIVTTPEGDPVDPSDVKAGDLLRVALLARFDSSGGYRRAYLAITDPLPAGWEPVQTDLASVTSDPGVGEQHPLSERLRWGSPVSHLEMHDDRVQIYVDEVHGHEVAASYLVRATTPGRFAHPPAMAELMYEPNSASYSEQGRVTIQ